MNYSSSTLPRIQNIDIFSKKDPAHVRMQLPYLFVVLFCIFVGVFAVWERVQYVRIGSEIQVLKQEHEKLIQERRNLLLEYNTSISLDRVEKRARQQLKMKFPDPDQIYYVK